MLINEQQNKDNYPSEKKLNLHKMTNNNCNKFHENFNTQTKIWRKQISHHKRSI